MNSWRKAIRSVWLRWLLLSFPLWPLVHLLATSSPYSADSYLHLAIGRFVTTYGAVPQHQDISFKEVESLFALRALDWMSDTLFYILSTFGNTAANVVLGLLLGLALGAQWRWLQQQKKSLVQRSSALLLSGTSAVVFWKIHPLTVAVPLLLSLVQLLDQPGRRRTSWRWVTTTLVLAANATGSLYGLFLGTVVLWAAARCIQAKQWLHREVLLAATAVGVGFFTPHPGDVYRNFFTLIRLFDEKKWYSGLAGTLAAANNNIIRNAPETLLFALYLAYLIFLCLGGVVGLIRYRKAWWRAVQPTWFVLWLVLPSVYWYRLIPLTVFLTLPVFLTCMQLLAKRWVAARSARLSFLTMILLTTSVFGIGVFSTVRTPVFPAPVNQIAFIRQHALPPTLLPSIELGGYTLFAFFPDRGHVDAQDVYFDEHDIISHYSAGSAVPVEFFTNIAQTYNVNTVLATKDTDYLLNTLNGLPDWSLVYIDYNGYIFVQKENITRHTLDTTSLDTLDLTRNAGTDPESLQAAMSQLERFVQHSPTSLALGQLASLYRWSGRYADAESALQRIPAAQWNYVVYTEYGRLQAARGNCKGAERALRTAIRQRDERNISRAVLDLAVVYAGCLRNIPAATHYFLRYNSYPLPPEERDRTRQIAKKFGIILDEEADETIQQYE